MPLPIEVEREDDGRWLAEIPDLPGVLAYGATAAEAIARVQALGLRTLADRVQHGEEIPAGGPKNRVDGSPYEHWNDGSS